MGYERARELLRWHGWRVTDGRWGHPAQATSFADRGLKNLPPTGRDWFIRSLLWPPPEERQAA